MDGISCGVLVVVAAGLTREIYMLTFDQQTALRDLRQLLLKAEKNLAF